MSLYLTETRVASTTIAFITSCAIASGFFATRMFGMVFVSTLIAW